MGHGQRSNFHSFVRPKTMENNVRMTKTIRASSRSNDINPPLDALNKANNYPLILAVGDRAQHKPRPHSAFAG